MGERAPRGGQGGAEAERISAQCPVACRQCPDRWRLIRLTSAHPRVLPQDPQDLRVALLRVLGDPTGTLGRLGLPGSAARAIPGSAASGSTGVGAPALATLGSLGVLGPARGPASAASANSALGPALWLNESTATHPLPPWPLFFDVVLPDRVRDGTHAGHVGHVGHALPTAAQPDCCYPFTDVVEFLHQYYVPVMIVMGLVGNLLSCVVFLNTHLRLRSSSYYLAALATADFGYLAVLVLVWLNSMHGVQVSAVAARHVQFYVLVYPRRPPTLLRHVSVKFAS